LPRHTTDAASTAAAAGARRRRRYTLIVGVTTAGRARRGAASSHPVRHSVGGTIRHGVRQNISAIRRCTVGYRRIDDRRIACGDVARSRIVGRDVRRRRIRDDDIVRGEIRSGVHCRGVDVSTVGSRVSGRAARRPTGVGASHSASAPSTVRRCIARSAVPGPAAGRGRAAVRRAKPLLEAEQVAARHRRQRRAAHRENPSSATKPRPLHRFRTADRRRALSLFEDHARQSVDAAAEKSWT